jgi:uncharacterized protein
MPAFEWDHDNEARNISKHGIDFTTAAQIWRGRVYQRADDRREYGEVRFQAFGIAENRILTVVCTWRGAVRRLISARRSNIREKILFERERERSGPPAD